MRQSGAAARLAPRFPALVPMPTALLIDLVKGVAVGIVIALPVGPVGLLCVRRTLFEGPMFGFVSGLGAATADTVFGIIAGFGLTIVRDFLLRFHAWLGVGGGVFLVYAGIKALRQRSVVEPEPLENEEEALFAAYASTFALTITNPITILAFAAIFAQVGVSAEAGYLDTAALVVGVFGGSLLWWLGLSFGIAGLRRIVGTVRLTWLNRISGAILALSGTGLLVAALLALSGHPL
ncbi:MAG TPA: LysE family transporter [Stellaceae bacterium]|nr:LysE family transporter [Stellaceae bacterium]